MLVDTSDWVVHFRLRSEALADLLDLDLVMMHPINLGEIACRTPHARAQTLASLDSQRQTQ